MRTRTGLIVMAGLAAALGCTKQETATQQPATSAAKPATDQEAAKPAAANESAAKPSADVAATQGIPHVSGDTLRTASGMKYIVMEPGNGAVPKAGQVVAADYTVWLTNGTKLDSSRDGGKPYSFPLGQGRVIKGWDEILATMKVGERRLLIVPPDLAYGAKGRGDVPPNATLVFDMQLMSIQEGASAN